MLWCLFCFFAVRCWRRGCFGPRAFVLRVVFCAARVVFLLFRGGVVFAPRVCRRGSFLFGVVAWLRRLSLLLLFLLPVPLRSLVWAHVYFRLGRWGRMLSWRCGHLLWPVWGACLFQVVAGVGRMFISGCGRCGAHVKLEVRAFVVAGVV